jgi:hypothetical protein
MLRMAVEVLPNAPVQVGGCHVFSGEPATTPRAGTVSLYLALFTPSSYRAGVHSENPGHAARGQRRRAWPPAVTHGL